MNKMLAQKAIAIAALACVIGFGLASFFLLLVSFSEHMPFGFAYTVASAACIGLLTFYLSYVLRSFARGLSFGAMLTVLYTAILWLAHFGR